LGWEEDPRRLPIRLRAADRNPRVCLSKMQRSRQFLFRNRKDEDNKKTINTEFSRMISRVPWKTFKIPPPTFILQGLIPPAPSAPQSSTNDTTLTPNTIKILVLHILRNSNLSLPNLLPHRRPRAPQSLFRSRLSRLHHPPHNQGKRLLHIDLQLGTRLHKPHSAGPCPSQALG
jgi:hypothetical protein